MPNLTVRHLALIIARRYTIQYPLCPICIIACHRKFYSRLCLIHFLSFHSNSNSSQEVISLSRQTNRIPCSSRLALPSYSDIMCGTSTPALLDTIDINRRIDMPPSRQYIVILTQYTNHWFTPHRKLHMTYVPCGPNLRFIATVVKPPVPLVHTALLCMYAHHPAAYLVYV